MILVLVEIAATIYLDSWKMFDDRYSTHYNWCAESTDDMVEVIWVLYLPYLCDAEYHINSRFDLNI